MTHWKNDLTEVWISNASDVIVTCEGEDGEEAPVGISVLLEGFFHYKELEFCLIAHLL